ncbi:MAG: DUF885 domain-containing protein [Gammaproteobacteria bacterium]
MKTPRRSLGLVLGVLVLAAACVQRPPSAPSVSGGTAPWDRFVGGFLEQYYQDHPTHAVQLGRHEFDGRLPDWRASALKDLAARLHAAHHRARAFDTLSPDARFERDYLIAQLERELFWLEEAGWPHKNPLYYSDALDPNVYVVRAYAPLAERLKAYVGYAEAVPDAVAQIRQNLAGPLPRTYLDLGVTVFGGLADYYEKTVPAAFAPVSDAALQARFRAANARAISAMRGLVTSLHGKRRQAPGRYALGAERFRAMLRATEGVDLPLERLEQVGWDDMARNLSALRAACNRYLPNDGLKDCVARMRLAKPAGGPVAEARRQLPVLKRFVESRGLVGIPGTEEAAVAESPPYQRWNPAYIDIPGPFEHGLLSIYYVAPPDPKWSPLERAAYLRAEADLVFISAHEVWPGHFLQHLHAHRARSRLAQVFVGYGFSEGWAHYAEELIWEAGFRHGDPAAHIGQLLNALLRNARYLSAIGLHTQGMTVAESERMFRELAFQDPANARQQAARGTFDPAYLNYTLGKLMIRKLRDDWTRRRGGRSAWRTFHDRLLSYGSPPIPLVRRQMLGPAAGPAL